MRKKIFFSTIATFALILSIGLNVPINAQTLNQPVNQKFFNQPEILQKSKLKGPNETIRNLMAKSPEQKISIKNGQDANIVFKQPGADWNPINASDEELKYYGYPQRPSDTSQLEYWKKIVSPKWVKPEIENTNQRKAIPKILHAENSTIQQSINWGGYMMSYDTSGANASWKIPTVSIPASTAYSSQWVGIGGVNGPALAQIGNRADVINSSGQTNYYAWFEVLNTDYPIGGEQKINSISCSPGDNVYGSVQARFYDSPQYVYLDFYMANTTKGQSTSFTVAVTTAIGLGGSAEWISERPKINGTLHNYPKTTIPGSGDYIPFWQAQYGTSDYSSDGWSTLSSSAPMLYTLVLHNSDTGHDLAWPGAITSGGSFNIYWQGYN